MSIEEITIETEPTLSNAQIAKIVADQNDQFRRAAFGGPVTGPVPAGQIVMTRGIAERDEDFRCAVMNTVAAYEDFNPDCDPHGWHEMGVIKVQDETVWFKIDLYDENYEYGASDPTEMRCTRRVLTLLFPSEY